VFLGPLLIVVLVIVIIVVVAQARARRDRHRVELQKAILERVGSVKDLAEFLTTEQGERFLSTLSPSHFGRERFRLVSVRVGVVLLTIGVFLMVALHSTVFGDLGDTPPPALWLGMVLLVAAGAGMVLSALVAVLIARGLGGRDGASGKGHGA
jgi:hypothetical protein